MRTRNVGIILVAMVLLVSSGSAYHKHATAASKKQGSSSASLRQKYLRGSMQGRSGVALDLNDDGNEDLVIGAPYAQHKGIMGALLVYLATPGGFPSTPSAVLEGDGNLGWSLVSLGDMDGDGKGYFAAGAYSGSGEHVSLSGTVTVYKGGDKPVKVTVLEGDNAMDKFGYALASGDLNDDGRSDLIVGAPLHSPSPALYQMGSVYVYFGPSYDPAEARKICATQDNKSIGFSLAAGDINNDGIDDLLMEAAGKVIGYYGGSSFSPSADPDVVFSSGDGGFGRAIAVLWDVNDDGYNDVAVGAYQAVISDIHTGRLYILKGGPSSLDLLATIDGEEGCGQFASAVLPVGDLDGDSTPELAVSAVHADGSPWSMTGKIYIFSGSTLREASVALLAAISGEARDMHLGTFLSLVSGGRWLAAGAPTEDANTGSVRLYDLGSVGNE